MWAASDFSTLWNPVSTDTKMNLAYMMFIYSTFSLSRTASLLITTAKQRYFVKINYLLNFKDILREL